MELQLFRYCTKKEEWIEFTDCSFPLVSYSFTEYASKQKTYWVVNLIWPTTGQYCWKGDFCLSLHIYRKVDSGTFKKILTKTSHDFLIFSKPSVYLKRKREGESGTKEVKKKENKFYQENTEKDLFSVDTLELTPPSNLLSQDVLNLSNK